MTITTPQGNIQVNVLDDSYRYRQIMGENYVELKLLVSDYIEVPVGSTITLGVDTYTLLEPQVVLKHSSRKHEISLRFEGVQASMRKYMYRDVNGTWGLKFSLTAKLSEHLNLLIGNLNEREGGWSYTLNHEDIEKTITVSHNYIYDVLGMIKEAYATEYEIVGKNIIVGKVEYFKEDPLPLSYGKGNGFKSGVKRDNYSTEKQIDILFVQGGERNIIESEYGSRYLRMPPGAIFEHLGEEFEVDEFGFSIHEAGKNIQGATEDSIDLSEIYPKFEGVVESVTPVDPAKNFYDFIDISIPDALDFSQLIIAGEKPLVIFQSGGLAGKEFEFSEYIHSTRTFKVVPQIIDGFGMPNNGAFSIQPGNKYIVVNIKMPPAYIADPDTKTGASWDMAREAARNLKERKTPRFSFIGELDGVWASQIINDIPRWAIISPKIKIGSHIEFSDTSMESEGVVIRITGIKDYLNKPSYPQIELSNISGSKSLSSALNKIETEKVVTKKLNDETVRYAKRGFREAQETVEAIQQSLLNFGQGINPITVSTMQLLVGDPSLQFNFVTNTTTPVVVPWGVGYNASTKILTVPSGIIQHKTIGINDVRPNRPANQYRYWSQNTLTVDVSLLDSTKYYYLYIKCSIAGSAGEYLMSATAKSINDGTYYYFLIGVLNSESEGDRSFAKLFGFTEVLPGRITTGLLTSEDGQKYINLLTGKIRGDFEFTTGSSVEELLGEASQNALDALQSAQDLQDFVDNQLPTSLSYLQSQIDGVVDSWFYDYTPSVSNYPASEWNTELLKSQHNGDTFTNTQQYDPLDPATHDAGKSWRWVQVSGVWGWTPIADSDAVKALLDAANAQDTADKKRRVFTTTPFPPYDIGDLWTQGSLGELMRCKTKRLTGTFSALDWEKATKYTSDESLINFIDEVFDPTIDSIANQVDRKIESWFQDTDPSTAWPTADDKYAHLGDMWYNSSTKLLKRYTVNNSVYGWELIEDQKAIDAYVRAGEALDTADGKRRVYTAQPTSADVYDIGDLWVNATFGTTYNNDLLRCKTAKIAGSAFSIHHWDLASRYTDDEKALIAIELSKLSQAKMMYRDPTFKNSLNGLMPYNNAGGLAVTVARVTAQAGCPNDSGYELKVSYNGGSASPGIGGFYFVGNQSRANAAYIVKFTAKVPIGYDVHVTYNEIGVSPQLRWLSDSKGTGEYTDYVYLLKCGATGTFSSLGFVYLTGPTTAINWYVAFATIYDITASDVYATQYLTQALQGSTDVIGGLLATNLLMVKDESTVTGGISGIQDDPIAMWAGGSHADALDGLAKFIVTKDGSAKMAGIIEALAGKIGGLNIFANTLKSESMSFSETPVETLASLISPVGTQISQVSSWSATAYNNTATAYTQSLVLTVDSKVSFKASCDPYYYADPFDRTWRVFIQQVGGSTVFQQSGTGSISGQIFNATLPAGTYVIKASASTVVPLGETHLNAASITGLSNTTIYALGYVYQTKIGNDGFYSFWDPQAYIYFKSNYGFEGRYGNVGIRFITGQSSPQKLVEGIWSNL